MDYGVESDQEWEDEPEGENLSVCAAHPLSLLGPSDLYSRVWLTFAVTQSE